MTQERNVSQPVRLYGSEPSSSTRRLRIALALKGIEFEARPVDLVGGGGEHQRGAYRAINPMAEVPSLEIDGLVLGQTLPILEYLEETRPEPPLLPADPVARAQARQIAECVNASIQPLQNLRVLTHLRDQLGAGEAQVRAWSRFWITRGFTGVEALLHVTAQTWCVGDAITIADVYVFPQVLNARYFGVKMSLFPTILQIARRLESVPEFQAAMPPEE